MTTSFNVPTLRRFAPGAGAALAGLGAQALLPKPWLADRHSHHGQLLPRLWGRGVRQAGAAA